MLGIGLRHQVPQRIEAETLSFHLVDQAAQGFGQARGLVLAERRHATAGPQRGFTPGQDKSGQKQLASQRRHGRRQIGRRCAAQAAILAGEEHLIGIEIAERCHTRQQERAALACPQHRLAQAAAGPAVGQKDPHPAEG